MKHFHYRQLSSIYNKTLLVTPDISRYRKNAAQSEWVQQNILETKTVCTFFTAVSCPSHT